MTQSTVMTESLCASETSALTYENIRCHKSDGRNMQLQRRDNLPLMVLISSPCVTVLIGEFTLFQLETRFSQLRYITLHYMQIC